MSNKDIAIEELKSIINQGALAKIEEGKSYILLLDRYQFPMDLVRQIDLSRLGAKSQMILLHRGDPSSFRIFEVTPDEVPHD